MFDRAAHALLMGQFVCEVSAPEEFRYLSDEGNRNALDAWLRKIGRRLNVTESGYAFYMAFEKVGPDERQEVKRTFAEIKHQLRPMINFMRLCMQAMRSEQAPTPGERIEFAAMLASITANAQLAEDLKSFPTLGKEFAVSDGTLRTILDRLFSQLTKSGYLSQIDREKEIYAFTGKVDYLDEALRFLMEHEQIAAESDADEADEQRGLDL